jgi:RNA-directed DNA polymerase
MINTPDEPKCEYEGDFMASLERPKAGLNMKEPEGKHGGIRLQELRQRIYAKAKAEPTWRFWGLYVHVCKMETLLTAYKMAKKNNGAPGIDGVTFEDIERSGVDKFLVQIQDELISGTYLPERNRKKEIPKGNNKTRVLGIPTIRDRVVQGAMKLILEPIFEAGFQDGSYGYRPGRRPQDAVSRVTRAIAYNKTKVIDLDLKSYFDNIRHHIVFKKVAERVNDEKVMHLLKLVLKANGKQGVPQGGVISPLIANLYLNELDRSLEQLKRETSDYGNPRMEYARFADDMVILVMNMESDRQILEKAMRRITGELQSVEVEINREKTRIVDLTKGESFEFLGFEFRRIRSMSGKWRSDCKPRMKSRAKLTREIKEICRANRSQPVSRLVAKVNPVVRGWVNYFRIGNSSKAFGYIRLWVELKIRRHLMRARQRKGFGWKRWSNQWIYNVLGLYSDYGIRHHGESISSQWVT